MYNRYWGRDRRRFQRLKVNLSVWYTVEAPLFVRNAVGCREKEAKTIDICEGGMAFISQNHIPIWTTLVLKLMFFKTDREGMVSFSDPVEIAAEVRSSLPCEKDEYRIGVCFKEIRTANKTEVAQFVGSFLAP
ncbi:MAG: PilZ domain-containing protein [Candidatus Omnitrophota bacterium]|jgi:c-di-GMP-binding flagellar brake protein YcgR|nr:MAG: PilZ domain-containing protein [Candidatus Omnitrophota bacterium]